MIVIRWNEGKDRQLRQTRGISLARIAELVLAEEHMDVIEHQSRENQQLLVFQIDGYTWAVPFVIEEDGTMFLKTAYPSRKLHKRYGGAT